jgi:hypothetical protein
MGLLKKLPRGFSLGDADISGTYSPFESRLAPSLRLNPTDGKQESSRSL